MFSFQSILNLKGQRESCPLIFLLYSCLYTKFLSLKNDKTNVTKVQLQ